MRDDGGNPGAFPSAEQLADPEFFRRLNPDLAITDRPFRAADVALRLSDSDEERLSRQLRQEGYFQSGPVVPSALVDALALGVTRLDRARVLPVFIGMYDEYWRLLRVIRHALASLLGGSVRMPPDFWAWHVPPSAARRGWRMHRDARLEGPSVLDASGLPTLLTVWIPFTDATTHNSCIYVVPFPHDRQVQSYLRQDPVDPQGMPDATELTSARALPAAAGSILGWAPYVAHWGSESTEWGTHARISVGIYCERHDAPEIAGVAFDDDGRRNIDVDDIEFRLAPEHRRAIVANNIATYLPGPHVRSEAQYSPAVLDYCLRWNRRGLRLRGA